MPDDNIRGLPIGPGVGLMLDYYDDAGWNYTIGTSFPAVPRLNERYFRADIRGGMLFRWDGAYWLSEDLFLISAHPTDSISVDTGGGRYPLPADLDVYITNFHSLLRTSTTLNGSNYWRSRLYFYVLTGAVTLVATLDNSDQSVDNWKSKSVAVNTLLASASGDRTAVYFSYEKVSSPGVAFITGSLEYRLRAV